MFAISSGSMSEEDVAKLFKDVSILLLSSSSTAADITPLDHCSAVLSEKVKSRRLMERLMRCSSSWKR